MPKTMSKGQLKRDFHQRWIFLSLAFGERAPHGFAWNANSILHTRCKRRVFVLTTIKKITDNRKGCLLFFGRSGGTRTRGLQYPKRLGVVFWLSLFTFWCFLVRKRCFQMLSFALFPHSPHPWMVKGVVIELISPISNHESWTAYTPCWVFLLPLV